MDIKALRITPDPASLPSDHLRALWYDLNGDWDTAHSIVQNMSDRLQKPSMENGGRKSPGAWRFTQAYA